MEARKEATMGEVGMLFRELEYKYRADDLKLEEFLAFVSENFKIVDVVTARGVDHFYDDPADDTRFARFRQGNGPGAVMELTVKEKRELGHSFDRNEWDLPLNPSTTFAEASGFLEAAGKWKYSFSITKANYVVRCPDLTFAFYMVDGKDRYLEIEARKGAFESTEEAWAAVHEAEQLAGVIGAHPEKRITKSLRELYLYKGRAEL